MAAQSVFYHLYNQVSYMSLDEISPLTFSIGNTMKRISVIVASIIIFQTPVQPINALGAAIAIFGTFLYSQVNLLHQFFNWNLIPIFLSHMELVSVHEIVVNEKKIALLCMVVKPVSVLWCSTSRLKVCRASKPSFVLCFNIIASNYVQLNSAYLWFTCFAGQAVKASAAFSIWSCMLLY